MRNIAQIALQIFAAILHLVPLFREPVVRLGGYVAGWILRDEGYSYEGRLRAFTYLQPDHTHPRFIGRNVLFINRRQISLNDEAVLYGDAYLNAGRNGYIKIGRGARIDVRATIYGQGGVTIGEACSLAAGVIVYSQTNQYSADPTQPLLAQPVIYAPVTIGKDVWIGAGAIILPGVTIGDHAVIGAGTLVRADIPSNVIAAGVPARILRQRVPST